MSELKLTNIVASYLNSNELIFNDISIEIKSNERIAIIGSSGSGKTSLLKLLMLALKLKSGKVEFKGDNPYQLSKVNKQKYRKKIGYLHQKTFLFEDEDVLNNLKRDYNGQSNKLFRWLGIITKKDLKVFEDILTKLNLSDYIFTNVKDLSGGQQQRVQIAKLLLEQPNLILADEPTTGLDYFNSLNVLESLSLLAKTRNSIMLVSLHDLSIIKPEYFDRVIGLSKGKIILDIPIEQYTSETIKPIYKELKNEVK